MKRNKARTPHIKPNGSFHYDPTLALPRTGQRAAEIQAFGTQVWFLAEHIVDSPLVTAE